MSGLIYGSLPGDVDRRAWYTGLGEHVILRHAQRLLTVEVGRNGFPTGRDSKQCSLVPNPSTPAFILQPFSPRLQDNSWGGKDWERGYRHNVFP